MLAPTRRHFLAAALAATIAPHAGVGAAPSVAFARRERLHRGFNLPAWADQPGSAAPSQELLDLLFHLGFRGVRLPIDPARIIGPDSGEILRHIAAAARKMLDGGFAVTLDLHPEAELIGHFRRDPKQAGTLAVEAWRALAPMIADMPTEMSFPELLNEPPLPRAPWLILRDQLAETVRHACPEHTIIWGAAETQGIWETVEHPVLADDNAIAAVHYYTPMGFTHQCANWSGPALQSLKNLPFPANHDDPAVASLRQDLVREGNTEALALLEREFAADWTYQRIADNFAEIGAWSAAQECPVILNEFGVLDFCVDPTSRENWIAAVRKAAENHGIAWTYWELDQGFGFVGSRNDPDSVDYGLVAALVAD